MLKKNYHRSDISSRTSIIRKHIEAQHPAAVRDTLK